MPSTELQELWGGKVERSVDGVTFTRVARVIGVKVPEVTFEKKKTTSLDSAARVNEYRKGMGEPGEFSVTCYYDSVNYGLAADDAAAAHRFYRITLPAGDKFDFKALVQITPPETSELDGVLEYTIGGSVSGAVTFVKVA